MRDPKRPFASHSKTLPKRPDEEVHSVAARSETRLMGPPPALPVKKQFPINTRTGSSPDQGVQSSPNVKMEAEISDLTGVSPTPHLASSEPADESLPNAPVSGGRSFTKKDPPPDEGAPAKIKSFIKEDPPPNEGSPAKISTVLGLGTTQTWRQLSEVEDNIIKLSEDDRLSAIVSHLLLRR